MSLQCGALVLVLYLTLLILLMRLQALHYWCLIRVCPCDPQTTTMTTMPDSKASSLALIRVQLLPHLTRALTVQLHRQWRWLPLLKSTRSAVR